MDGIYADVIIDISHEKVDKVFQYKIPEELREKVNIGTPVMIPFGRGNTLRQGYVVGISDTAQWDEDKIKEIKEVSGKQLSIETRLIELAGWMKEYYGSTMIAALKTVTPVKEKVKRRGTAKTDKSVTGENDPESIQTDVKNILSDKHNAIDLNRDQLDIISDFRRDFEAGRREKYLLHGVTGSGKTEVYIELVKEAVRNGKTAIVLIPEIALTLQTVERFESAFGNRISIINSRLSKGEKYTKVVAIGPMIMMKFVCLTTKELGIPTIVSMNPIMVDGTGMCGACRLKVGDEIKFACVDGPEFDGHLIDFDGAMQRARMYKSEEGRKMLELEEGDTMHNSKCGTPNPQKV
jgi:primosomal protein N'